MKFYKKKPIAGIFILINILYLTQGILPSIGMFYKLLLFLILAISFFYIFRTNSEYGGSPFIKSLNLFILLITIYGLVHIITPLDPTLKSIPNYRSYTYLTNAYISLLQIYPLYFFSRKGYIDEEVIKSWILPSLVAAIMAYHVKQQSLIEELSLSAEGIETTNNIGYVFVTLFPLLFFLQKTSIKYVMLVVFSVFVFVCAKRGAIIIAGISILWFFYHDLKQSSTRVKIWTIILAAVVGVLLFRVLSGIYEESYYLQYLYEKTEDGNSSGRDNLYSNAWNIFIHESDFFSALFGHGANSTYHLLGNRAHNDWLELLTNQGLLGVFVFLLFWIQIFKQWIKSKSNSFIFEVLGAIIIVFFLKTLFSMFYNDISPIICLPFAWCLAFIDSNQKQLIK